jgi:hypothetical protein
LPGEKLPNNPIRLGAAFNACRLAGNGPLDAHSAALEGNDCQYHRASGACHRHQEATPNFDVNKLAEKSREIIWHGAAWPNYAVR